MLDEPTNHLDLLALLWFQRYLTNYPGAILMISHDRDFMDAIAEAVVEIDEQKLILDKRDECFDNVSITSNPKPILLTKRRSA